MKLNMTMRSLVCMALVASQFMMSVDALKSTVQQEIGSEDNSSGSSQFLSAEENNDTANSSSRGNGTRNAIIAVTASLAGVAAVVGVVFAIIGCDSCCGEKSSGGKTSVNEPTQQQPAAEQLDADEIDTTTIPLPPLADDGTVQQQETPVVDNTPGNLDELAVLEHDPADAVAVQQVTTNVEQSCLKPIVDRLINDPHALVPTRNTDYSHRPLTKLGTGPIKADCASFVQYVLRHGCGRGLFDYMWEEQHYFLTPEQFPRPNPTNAAALARVRDGSYFSKFKHAADNPNPEEKKINTRYYFPASYLSAADIAARKSPAKRIQAEGFWKLFAERKQKANTGASGHPYSTITATYHGTHIPGYNQVKKVVNMKPYDMLAWKVNRELHDCPQGSSGHAQILLEKPEFVKDIRARPGVAGSKEYKLYRVKMADASSFAKYDYNGVRDTRRTANGTSKGIGAGWIYIYAYKNTGTIAVVKAIPRGENPERSTKSPEETCADFFRCNSYSVARFGSV